MYKRAQSINEYVLVITLITIAGIGMLTYVKRGIQGNIKATADILAVGGKTDTALPAPVETGLAGLADGNIYQYDKNGKKQWHPVAQTYYDNYGGFPTVVKSGNDIYYYITKDGVKTKIGGQDAVTGDFTSYDWEGYPVAVYNSSGVAQHLYTRVEDYNTKQITYSEVNFEIVKGIPVALKDSVIRTGLTYNKYEMLRLNSTPSEGNLAQQKGIVEPGLVKYEMKPPGLVVNTQRNITVTETALKNPAISRSDYHPFVSGNYKTGFIDPVIKDSNLYYYHFTSDADNKTFIGAEDISTRDFTKFDPAGFAEVIFKENGDAYTDLEFIYKDADGREVKGSDTREVASVTVKKKDGSIIGTYKKYQPVRISSTLPSWPLPTASNPIRMKDINDEVTVSGAWTATYKLENKDTFGALEKQKGKTGPGPIK